MEERFRKIEDNGTKFSHYLVSNMGRVLSTWRKNRHILKPGTVGSGYKAVNLVDDDGNAHQFYVHRLVAQAFIANPDSLPEINHKDEDKANNCADNLEWCDRLHNMRHGTWVERARATKELRRKEQAMKPVMLDDLIVHLEIAKEHGVAVALLVGTISRLIEIKQAEGQSKYCMGMKDMAEATGMSYRQVREAAKKAKEAGLLGYRFGYYPDTLIRTTYWSLKWKPSEERKEIAKNANY